MTLIEVPRRTEPPSWSMACAAAFLGLFGGLFFAAFPQADIAVSRLFHVAGDSFLFSAPSAGSIVRDALRWLFILACVAAAAGFAGIAFASRRLFRLGFSAWLYVVLTVVTGPGLVANVVFKDHWGRARPHQTVEFGGAKQFTPALTRSDQCDRNCSFVSGEASSFFALGFAIMLLAERARRRALLIAALAAGALAGLVRIGAGAHYLSDVFFAGVFMAFVARGLYWLLFERFELWFADEGPLHRRTLHAGRRGGEHAARLLELARKRRQRLAERAREIRERRRR
jgi:lipid A 4'-phosphatase